MMDCDSSSNSIDIDPPGEDRDLSLTWPCVARPRGLPREVRPMSRGRGAAPTSWNSGALAAHRAKRALSCRSSGSGRVDAVKDDTTARRRRDLSLGYPGRLDGTLPAAQQTVIDPLVALTVAATVTEHVTIGTDVLVASWYAPVLLARTGRPPSTRVALERCRSGVG